MFPGTSWVAFKLRHAACDSTRLLMMLNLLTACGTILSFPVIYTSGNTCQIVKTLYWYVSLQQYLVVFFLAQSAWQRLHEQDPHLAHRRLKLYFTLLAPIVPAVMPLLVSNHKYAFQYDVWCGFEPSGKNNRPAIALLMM